MTAEQISTSMESIDNGESMLWLCENGRRHH